MSTRARHAIGRPGRAFTLVEAVAAMCVIAAVAMLGSTVVHSAMRSYRSGYGSLQLHQELSLTLERIVRELRRVEMIGVAPGRPDITSVTADSIEFGAGSSFRWQSGAIRFVDSGAPAVLLGQSITAFSVRCYDQSNAALAATLSGTACEPVRRIEVQITAQRDGESATLRTRVFLRSTMAGGVP
jgi:type II secretory pathway component PulJ